MIGATLNHYRIVGSLGSGGMGEVYAADDTRLGRRIALKVLPPSMAADRARLARFEREARAVAALNHPNVVTIYSVEQAGEVHFLTMELVEGKTLSHAIPPEGLATRELLRIAIPLTEAIAAAHRAGVVHRDLKPANVMLGADGRLKVLDFGLAKLSEPASGDSFSGSTLVNVTAEHHVIGTAAYMSPEQAEGKTVDHRSDIFSLGVILYELATGSRPFRGETTASMISSILRDDPKPISETRPLQPADLDRIVARCLVKDPEHRYQSALDLRNDLEELQRTITTEHPAARRPRRIPAGLLAAGIVALIAAAAAVVVAVLKRPGAAAVAPFRATFSQLTSAPGQELFPTLSPDGKWFAYAADGAGNRDIYLQSVGGLRAINLTPDSTGADTQPAFSPDGERIAFRSSREGGGIFVMGRTGEAVRRLTPEGFNPSWSPDGKEIVFAFESMEIGPLNWEGLSTLSIVTVDDGTIRRLSQENAVQPTWSPAGHRILYVSRKPIREGERRRLDLHSVPAAGGPPVALTDDDATDWNPAWSADGRHVYFSSDRGGSMNLWRIPVDETTGKPRGEPEPITTPAVSLAHVAVARDGSRIAYSSVLETQNIQRITIDPASGTVTGEPFWVTTGSRLWSSADPSPDGQWIAFYSRGQPEGHVYVIRSDGTGLRQVTSSDAMDRVPRWSPDGKWIAVFSTRAGPIGIWKMRPDGSELQRVSSGKDQVSVPVWSPDGARIAASTALTGRGEITDPKVYLFDSARTDQDAAPTLPKPPSYFIAMSWSPDGRFLAGQERWATRGLFLFSFETGTYERLTDYGEWPAWLDDHRILFVSRGKEFLLLDVRTKEVRPVFSVPRDVIGPPRLTRDGHVYFSRRVTEADIWMATIETEEEER